MIYVDLELFGTVPSAECVERVISKTLGGCVIDRVVAPEVWY
jgi:hypothetical protein